MTPCDEFRSQDGTRAAFVYLVTGTSSTYRIRVHHHPEKSGASTRSASFPGGCVLWGHDKPSVTAARKIASDWVTSGILPGGYTQ